MNISSTATNFLEVGAGFSLKVANKPYLEVKQLWKSSFLRYLKQKRRSATKKY